MALDDLGTHVNPMVPQSPSAPAIMDLDGLSASSLNSDFLPAVKVSVFREATVQVVGSFVGTLTFQGSLDGTSWYSVPAVPIAGGSLVTAVTVPGMWIVPLAFKWLWIRRTAYTSGIATGQIRVSTLPLPIDALVTTLGVTLSAGTAAIGSLVAGTAAIGAVGPSVPATPYIRNSTASTNGALVLTGTSGLQALYATNIGATPAYVKLYNKATAPVVGIDVPTIIVPVPAAVSGFPGMAQVTPGFSGYRFALGLGIAITGAAEDNDTTDVAAGQVKVHLSRTV